MVTRSRVVIAEDHTIVREGLRALLSASPDIEIVGEVEDGREAVKCVETLLPDLILMDLSMPKMHGIDAIREIKRRNQSTKILVLTVHKTEEYIMAAFQGGADGYVLKDASHAELQMAIRNVLSGKPYLSPSISERVLAGYLEWKRNAGPKSSWETLTPREREILKLVAEGYKNKKISSILCISVKTVEKHRSNLMQKLKLHSVSALTAFAMEKGLISE